MSKLGEYVNELTQAQGILVSTVTDGWVFTMTRSYLQTLLDDTADDEMILIFVKSSESQPKN